MENQNQESEMLEFTVMPPGGSLKKRPEEKQKARKFGKKSLWIWAAGALLIIVLSWLGYLSYKNFFQKNQGQPVNLPETNLNLPPDETKDSDNDGLTDELEQEAATNPQNSDTDGDGLADGDEVFVYKTDPLLSDSDSDGYDDGREVARGYSPLMSSTQKAPSELLAKWAEDAQKAGLHEPTLTTLKLKKELDETQTTTYTNATYKYSLELPTVLTYREKAQGQEVGIYIAGTAAEDEDVLSDPISLSLATKIENQTLKDWVSSQFAPDAYDRDEEEEINSIKVIHLYGVKNEVCNQEKLLYPKNGVIIVLTLTCDANPALLDLFAKISQSFKFLK